ncbi:hypothetical protein MNBD_GAMMA17-1991 [hydrothermal vent metagenome]|uniref:Ancillary SecYEG translocon subunit/Cell division coordinator CpoB TPR domain-containing protein n=1 Tax=hydrothermal vent metagenome TaxID=652676 RepID=A0A3B0ZQY4_9ZZZZ
MNSSKYIVIFIILSFVMGCSAGTDEVAQMGNAQQSLKNNDARTAMIKLKSTLQDDPENRSVRRLLGELYLRQGDGGSAQTELLRVQQLGENGAEISLLLAQAFMLGSEFDDALKSLSLPDVATSEQLAEAGLMRGDIYMAQKEQQKAMDAYDVAISAMPNSQWALLAGVKLLLLERDLKQAIAKMIDMTRAYPDSVDGWLLQGRINTSMADYAAAEISYGKALGATGTEQHTRFGFQARLGLIQAALAQSNASAASKHVNVLLTQLPNHPMPKYFDALLLYQKQEYSKAAERLAQVLNVMERHLPSQLLMGATQYALGQYEQASRHLTRVINAIPAHQQARKMLAAVHMKLQSPDEAVRILASAAADESADAELLRIVGVAAISAGDVAGGQRYLNRALAQGESAEIRSELAKVYLAQGEYNEAIKELEEISGDRALQARIMIALTHVKQGDIDSAMAEASALEAGYPEEAIVDALMGSIHQVLGDRGRARESYRQALAKNRLFVPALLELAKLDAEDSHFTESEQYFKQVLRADSNNLRAFFGLAKIAESRNEMNQAIDWIERASMSNPAAIEPALMLARYYIRGKQFEKAAGIVAKGIQSNPNNILLMRMDAQINFSQGNKVEAVEILKGAMLSYPDDSSIVTTLAAMQRKLGSNEQARRSLLRGLRSIPDALSIEIALIDLEISNAWYAEAEARINALKKKRGSNAVVYALDGQLNLALKKYESAVLAYQQAFNLAPSLGALSKLMRLKHQLGRRDEIDRDVEKWRSLSASNLASEDKIAGIYLQLGENSQAIQFYESAIRRDAGNVPALNNLAWLYSLVNDSRSVAVARKAVELAPGVSSVVDTLGWALVKSGHYEEGVEHLRMAHRMSKDNDDIALHLVEALLKSASGKREAKKLLSDVIKRNPQARDRKDVQRLSSQLGL